MTHKLNRLTALVLAIVMAFSVLLVPASAASYNDVSENAWYKAAVDYVQEKGWMAGVSETSFAPNKELTRGMMVTVLARVAGAETDNGAAAFSDTSAGKWYTGAASWAAENGIVSGVGDGKFAPNRAITRQDLCVMLYRYITLKGYELKNDIDRTFSDMDSVAEYAREAVIYCTGVGLVTGFEDSTFRPKDTATRAQVAQLMMRLDLLVKGENAPTDPMPAQSFEGEAGEDMAVSVNAPEGALPENTKMTVSRVSDEAALNAIASKVDGELLAAADITFTKDGAELEPNAEVEVQIELAGLENVAYPVVVHVKADGSVERVNAQLVTTNRGATAKALRFMAKDFSVYAVLEGDESYYNARLVVKIWKKTSTGYEIDKDANGNDKIMNVTRQDIGRLGTLIPDGETPVVYGKEIFCGWYLDTEEFNGGINEARFTTADADGQHTMDAARDGIEALLQDSTFTIVDEETTVNIYPIIFNYFVVSLVDENGETTYDTTVIYTKENYAKYTPQMEYTPYLPGYRFIGWQKDDSDPTVYDNGEETTVTEQYTVFRAQVQRGYWLSFNENPDGEHRGATYNGPRFCVDGVVTSAERPADPKLNGYTFGGWYTDNGTFNNRFTFDGIIDGDTTLYAKWTQDATVPYTVVLWKQSVEDDKDALDADKTYDYVFSTKLSAAPGTSISSLNLSYYTQLHTHTTSSGNTYNYYMNSKPDESGSWTSFYGFEYNSTRGITASNDETTVQINGTTVINIYWNRRLATLDFKAKYNTTTTWSSGSTYVIGPDGNLAAVSRYSVSGGYAYYFPISSMNYLDKTDTANQSYTDTHYFFNNGSTQYWVWWNGSAWVYGTSANSSSTFTESTFSSYGLNYWMGSSSNSSLTGSLLSTYTFFTPGSSWNTLMTYTGLVGQKLSKYGYPWPTDLRWFHTDGSESAQTRYLTSLLESFPMSVQDEPYPHNDPAYSNFYGESFTSDATVEHFFQTDDETAIIYPASGIKVNTDTTTGMVFRSFTGFSASEYRVKLPSGVTTYQVSATETNTGTQASPNYTYTWGSTQNAINGWTDWIPENKAVKFDGFTPDTKDIDRVNPVGGKNEYRYTRNKYRITYMVGGYFDENGNTLEGPVNGTLKQSNRIYYEKDISSYATYYTNPEADLHTDEFVFAGWYQDPTCKQLYSFAGKHMPVNGITLYAKFIQKEYRVFVHPNIPAELPAANVNWPNGEKSNMKVNYLDMVEGGNSIVIRDSRPEPEWVLVGWYTDEACTQLYNFETKLTDETVTETYNQTEITDYGPYTASDGTVWGANGGGFNKDAAEDRFWITTKLDLYAKWRKVLSGASGLTVKYDAIENSDEHGKFIDVENTPTEWTDPLSYTDKSYVIARSASTPDAPDDYQFLYWQILKADGTPYTLSDGETLDPDKLIYAGQRFQVNAADAKLTTIPTQDQITTHQHTTVFYPEKAPSCLDGNWAYYYCTSCGHYYWDAACTIEAVYDYQQYANDGRVLRRGDGQHTFPSEWTSNNDGTHSKTCTTCHEYTQTQNCTFNDVVTPPTTTSQGYTTHTCTLCGYTYVDSYVDPTQTTYTVTAVAGDHGTVSPASAVVIVGNGTTFTAAPVANYMLSAVTVSPSSAAQASFAGNTVTVSNVTADCTVTLSFTALETCTVTYMANGSVYDTETVAKNSTVTLPSSATTPGGCTLLGWVQDPVSATKEEQTGVLALGATSPVITGDKTFYALYSYERSEPITAYELLTAAPSDWAGRYVITCYTTTSLVALKGLSGNTSYESASAGGSIAYANTGMTRFTENGKTYLRNVANDYVFTAASVSGGYSLRNAATSTYLGSYNDSLYSRSSYSASYCVWSLVYDSSNNCMQVSNSSSSQYPYLVKGSNSYFVVNDVYTTNKTYFWKETTINSSSTYYSTQANVSFNVTLQSNNTDYGTVSPASASLSSGETANFTGAPKTGYTYASTAYTVSPAGAATVTRNGNQFTLSNVTADCTVTVNFAPESYTVTAQLNNSSYGSVSVSGSPVSFGSSATVTVTPSANCVYANLAYTVTSGTATVTQNGNVFTVTPTSNCTVTINLVRQYTVSYSVNGTITDTDTVNAGESVTLPTAALSGYTFVGWRTSTLSPTTTEQTGLTGSYTPTGNVTLYAIYSYNVGGTSKTGYVSRDGVTDFEGNWVITYGTQLNSMYFLKGLSGNTSYESSGAGGATLYSNTGATYDSDIGGTLFDVPSAYIWTSTRVGEKYSLQNVSTGTYLGSYNSYLYSRTSYSASYCLWTLANDGNGNDTAQNDASSSYSWLSFSSSYFAMSGTQPTGMWFWHEETVTTGGTTYYSTTPGAGGNAAGDEPAAQHEADAAASVPAAPAEGMTLVRFKEPGELQAAEPVETESLPANDPEPAAQAFNAFDFCADPVTSVDIPEPVGATTDKYQIVTSFTDGGKYIIAYRNGNYDYLVSKDEYSSTYGRIKAVRATRTQGSDGYYTFSSDVAEHQWKAALMSGSQYSLYNETTGGYLGLYAYNSTAYTALMNGGQPWAYTNSKLYVDTTDTYNAGDWYMQYNSSTTYGTYGSFVFNSSSSSGSNFVLYKLVSTHKLTVNFLCTDGTTPPATIEQDVLENTDFDVTIPEKTNYTAAVTSGSATLSNYHLTGRMGTSDMTVTVTYTRSGHTVTFVDGCPGHENDPAIATVTVDHNGTVTPPTGAQIPNHESEYYYFIGWTPEDFDNITEDRTYTARYEYRRTGYYAVTFRDWNGTVIPVNGQNIQYVEEGKNAIAPAIPERSGFYFKTWDKDFRNVTENMTVYATYASVISKVYTVSLKAIYGPVTPIEKTHIDWYANNGTQDSKASVAVKINESISIEDQTTYAGLVNEGYTFLGWARMPEYTSMADAERDVTCDESVYDAELGYRITQYNDLDTDDLWLVYNQPDKEHTDPYFTVRETVQGEVQYLNGGAAYSYVAANESDPYHGLYAVWKRDVFYVMHSSTGTIEAVAMPIGTAETGTAVAGLSYRVGTFDVTSLVNDGYLYGGYYSIYGGADDAAVTKAANTFTFANKGGWNANTARADVEASHAVDGWSSGYGFTFTAYDGAYTYVTADGAVSNKPQYQLNPDGSYARDENGRPILISSKFWTASNAKTVNGRAMTPTVGEVYYLKEVPNTYLRSKIIYVQNEGGTEVVNNYLLSYVDDNLYQNIGFKCASGNSLKYTKAQSITPKQYLLGSFTISVKINGETVPYVIDNTTFGLDHGLVSVLDASSYIAEEQMVMIPSWETYDHVIVENDPMLLDVMGNLISCSRVFPKVLYVDMDGALGDNGQPLNWLADDAKPFVYLCNDALEMQVFVELEQVGDSNVYMCDLPDVEIEKIVVFRIDPDYDEPVWDDYNIIYTKTNDIVCRWSETNDCLTSFKAWSSDATWGTYIP